MMTVEALKDLLESNIPDSVASVRDMTGTSDHFDVHIISPAFTGKSTIEQHKLVHKAVGMHLTTTIHALQIKTSTPS